MKNELILKLTEEEISYIADYIFHECEACENFSEMSLDCFERELDLEEIILNAISAIEGGAMESEEC